MMHKSGHHGWKHHRGSLLALPAAYLGISTDALKDQLKSGKTLAQVAAATPGKSAQGLVDYLVAQAKTKLDAKVAAGKLTQAQEDAWLAKLTSWVTAVVNGSWHR
jgi:ribosomal protein L10